MAHVWGILVGRGFALAALLGLALVACGTRVEEARLAAAGGILVDGGAASSHVGLPGATRQQSVGPGGSVGTSGLSAPGVAVFGPAGEGGAGSGSPTRASTKSEVLLGSWGTMSGIIGAILKAMPVAVRAWASKVNATGGLNGHPVRVISRDDGGDPARALAIVRQMVEEDHVIALFGNSGATTQAAVAPYLEEKRIPMIGGAIFDSPMWFNPQAGNKGTYRGYIKTVIEQSKTRKISVIYCREAAACGEAADEIRTYGPKLGASIVHEAQVSLAQPDYTAEVLSARNAGAEVIIISIDNPSTIRLARNAHRQGWFPVLSGGPALYETAFTEYGGEDVEGVLAFSTTLPWSTSPKMAEYRDAVARYVPGGAVSDFGAWAWVGGKLMERIAPFIHEKPTTEQLLDGLYSLRNDTLGGLVPPLTFPKGKSPANVNLCVVPIKVVRQQWAAPFGDKFVCSPEIK